MSDAYVPVLTRDEVAATHGVQLPDDMGPTVELFDGIDDGTGNELCTVAVWRDVAFCVTCERHGYLDGYRADHDDIQQWHRDP